MRADFQKQLLQLQREIGFSYVRFHGIFHDDMAVYREDEAGEPAFWFGYVDSLMDLCRKHLRASPTRSFGGTLTEARRKVNKNGAVLWKRRFGIFANATAKKKCATGILKCGTSRI